MDAVLIMPNGMEKEVKPKNGTHFQLDEMYAMLDCEIVQFLNTQDDRLMICDEMGKLRGLEVNTKATDLYEFGIYDPIVGAVLICKHDLIK